MDRTSGLDLFVAMHSLCQFGQLPGCVNFTAHDAVEQCKTKLPKKDHRKGKEAMTRMKEGIEDEPSRLSQAGLVCLYSC